MTRVETSIQPDYIDSEEHQRARRKHQARERLREIQERRSATPAPLRGVNRTATPVPAEDLDAGTLAPVALRLANPVAGAGAALVDLLIRAMRPLGPGLVALCFAAALSGSMVIVGGVQVNRSASRAAQAQLALFATVAKEATLSDDLAALGNHDDSVRVIQLTLASAKSPEERIERTRALLQAGKVAHERLRLSSQANRMLLDAVGARLERIEAAITSMETAQSRWSHRAGQGLGRIAVNLGVASRP